MALPKEWLLQPQRVWANSHLRVWCIPEVFHSISYLLLTSLQTTRKWRKYILWLQLIIVRLNANSKPEHFHLMATAQLMLNSMRRQNSKWKLMMRTHRAPCVINQHATEDVCSRALYLISRTERRAYFSCTVCTCRGISVRTISPCAEQKNPWWTWLWI